MNIPKFTLECGGVPQHHFTNASRSEISLFRQALWVDIVRKLMMLLAIALELPEQYFTERQAYNCASEEYLRCMGPVKVPQVMWC